MGRIFAGSFRWFCFLAPVLAFGQSVVIGSRSPQGQITFQAVEDFQVNQSKKIKLLPDPKGKVDPNAVKRLPKTELAQAGIIRADGNHLVRLQGAGAEREIVLPESFALKSAANVSDVPGRLVLTLVHSKKAKQSDTLAPELFFVYLNGGTPDGAALDFVSKDWAFTNLEEQLAAMQGFVGSFPNSPAVDEFRGSLERRLASGLAAFENGGPYKDLVLLRRFGELGRRAYPKDAPLQNLQERIVSRIDFVEARLKLLRSLAILGDWDAFLQQYSDFERYQWSFADITALRQEALEESARVHARRARAFAMRDDHESAAKEAEVAQGRDPVNREIGKLLEAEKVLSSQVESRRTSASRILLVKDSPEERRFQRSLSFADRAMQDKDYAKAQEALQDAGRENPDAPEVLLGQARLLAARDRLSEALPLLDRYDRMVVESGEREKGAKVRDEILYELGKKKEAYKHDIEALTKTGQYSKLDELLKSALLLDASDPDFLFNGGLVAAATRDSTRAKALLTTYLDRSNSLVGDLKQRGQAERIRSAIVESKQAAAGEGTLNWLSGRKLPAGVYYCPESLAFQIPIDSVVADKVKMQFAWDKGRLESIITNFDDPKGYRTYRTLAAPGTTEDLQPGSVEEFGKFYFQYPRTPGALLTARIKPAAASPQAKEFRAHVVHDDKGLFRMVDDDNQTEIVLPGNPSADLRILGILAGPVGTTIAGNSFFNPFLWDGLHYFTVQYDAQDRAESAQEWGADNLVRFSWDGQRLTGIRAFKKGSDKPYYQRTVTYSGSTIASEDFSLNGKSGHIRYVYGNDRSLQQIKIENEGKDWTAKPRS